MPCIPALRLYLMPALFFGPILTSAAQGVISVPIREFFAAGPTDEVVRKLVRSASPDGAVGFENLGPSSRQPVSVLSPGPDLGAVFRAICERDPRYKVVETGSADMVNILPADGHARGHDVLEHRLPRFDLEADGWPYNLITSLAGQSPDLHAYLSAVYFRAGGHDPAGGLQVSGLTGDVKPPHFSIHLDNPTVRDVLNSISLQSIQAYRAIGPSSTTGQKLVRPTGWEFDFSEPGDKPYLAWVTWLFRPLM
jgi:hypothetical protein